MLVLEMAQFESPGGAEPAVEMLEQFDWTGLLSSEPVVEMVAHFEPLR
jgi:hypothetical protein